MAHEVGTYQTGIVLHPILPRPANDDNDAIEAGSHGTVHAAAKAMRRARLRRSTHFKASLFSDPAWDILLDLFLAECEGRRLSVTGSAYSAEIPPTTTLRWVGALELEGLVRRENDAMDKRRVFLQLTDAGLRSMREYFESCDCGHQTASHRHAF